MKKCHYRYLCAGILLVVPSSGLGIWHASRTAGNSSPVENGMPERGSSAFRSEWGEKRDQQDSRRRGVPGRKSIAFYEAALEKYPDMRPEFRDIPDEHNGYLQLILLIEGWEKAMLPDDLRNMLQSKAEWDAGKLRVWYEKNQQLVERLLAVTALPERSMKDVGTDRVYGMAARDGVADFSRILSGLSRMAAESGNEEDALRFIKGCIGIDEQLSGTEAPGFLAGVLGVGSRSLAEKAFTEHHLARLAGDPESLRKWRDVVLARPDPAQQIRRMYLGEWNWMVRQHIAPLVVGDHPESRDPNATIRNPDGFMDTYTGAYRGWMADLSTQEAGKLNLAGWKDAPRGEHLQGDDPGILEGAFAGIDDLTKGFGLQATGTAQAAAVVSIMLGEEPPVDPVSGLPFVWDPATRTLARPGGDQHDEVLHVP